MIVIGHGIDDSYLGLGILLHNLFELQPFCAHYFAIILYVLSFFLSFIATGLAMCRLGGVISAQKVLF